MISWILLILWLINKGHNGWAAVFFFGGIVLFIVLGISQSNEEHRARVNRNHYWAHYYDKERR